MMLLGSGPRRGLGKYSSVFAAGSALFSDGYQNGVVGAVNTILSTLYPVEFTTQHSQVFSSMAFAGTVVGMLGFGWLVDKVGRKTGMMSSAVIIIIFAALSAGAYSGGSVTGMLNALSAYRFLIGIGIGGEYPAGSVAASENTEAEGIAKGSQHFLFAMATNVQIDFGFVIAAIVPLLWLLILGQNNLDGVWRASFALGVLFPIIVLFWRFEMRESTRYAEEGMKHAKIPYLLIWKRYWKSFIGVSFAWFVYDFIAYSFNIYGSKIIALIIGGDAPLVQAFSWSIFINAMYIPGCVGGALIVDRVLPKRLMILALIAQAVIGFFMSGFYVQLEKNVAGFAVMYAIFLAVGEVGPGNCLGLLASKSWPTAARGSMYGAAAAIGKIGAFVGTYTFPEIIDAFPDGPSKASGPFFIGSGLAILSALIVALMVDEIHPDHMTNEDALFRAYLVESGYDTSMMGTRDPSVDSLGEEKGEKEDSMVVAV